ncbi:site-specific integrase [Vibrio campbellii]|uniref:site-specific integrase n=1 Tax=Vibrio campbellii TaxID=680 RepID=UPI00215D34B6|nr:site-specific integrase [Vibrio campbellii]MCR9909730.1 site-specific integrase [Vibrio campbellii]
MKKKQRKLSNYAQLLDQSQRYLRSYYVSFKKPRHGTKRADKSSASVHSVNTFHDIARAIAHAVNFFEFQRLKHLTETHALVYLLHRHKIALSDKALSRDKIALQRLLHRRLPNRYELHLLEQHPTFTDKWIANFLLSSKNPKLTLDGLEIKQVWKDIQEGHIDYGKQNKTSPKGERGYAVSTRPNDSRALKDQSRAYTKDQIIAIAESFLDEKTRLSILIAYNAGLRVSELIEIRRVGEGKPISNQRDWLSTLHTDRGDTVTYVVTGKGGLVRTIALDRELATRLEARRLDQPRECTDRGIKYLQYYDLRYGNNLSKAFSNAAVKVLGFSKGAHGLRHTFAQERVMSLSHSFTAMNSKHVVSQELGHMRPSITNTYLR